MFGPLDGELEIAGVLCFMKDHQMREGMKSLTQQ